MKIALIFSKNYQWIEELYQTLDTVFHPIFKQLEVGLKRLGYAFPFFNYFSVFGNRMKHSSSCLTHYVKYNELFLLVGTAVAIPTTSSASEVVDVKRTAVPYFDASGVRTAV